MSRHFGRLHYHHILSPIVVIAVFSILMLVSLPTIPKSYAHAFVINSNPTPSQTLKAPPTKVEVHLSEPVDLRYSKLSVIDQYGKQVDNKNVQYANGDQTALSVILPHDIKDGLYTVSTKMLSQIDGHVTDNAFVFGVGEAKIPNNVSSESLQSSSSSSQLSILDAIARFPALVGQVMIVGAAFATLWLWKPMSKINWLKNDFAQTRNSVDRSLIKLLVIGSVILVLSDFGMIYVQAYSINAGIADAIATKFGTIWIARTSISFVILVIAVFIYLKLKKTSSAIPSKQDILSILVAGLAILVTTTLIGHSSAVGHIIPIAIDFVHNLAASIWIGSIIYLAFVVVPKIKKAPVDEYVKASVLSIIIPRFSTIPIVILGIIVITGPFLLYILEDNLDLILASLYGKALIAKLVLAAVMISIGGYNQTVIYRQALNIATIAMNTSLSISTSPTRTVSNSDRISSIKRKRPGAAAPQQTQNNKEFPSSSRPSNSYRPYNSKMSTVSKFNTSTKVEAIVGILLLVAVAVLVNTGLPASEFQNQQQMQQKVQLEAQTLPSKNIKNQTFTFTKFAENASRIKLSIDPFTPGNNNFKISFLDQNRNPLDINSVKMKLTQIEQGIGPIEVDTKQISKGIFSANAAFGLSGEWNVLVEAFQNKANSLNIVATYNLFVKPTLDQIKFNVREFRITGNNNSSSSSQPLYPLYDNSRNVIWVGDTVIDSSRIFEFRLNSNKFTEHNINGTSIVTVMALDHNNQIWYADPLMRHLGHYDPDTHTNQIYKIPSPEFIVSGIAIDRDDNVWLTSANSSSIFRFNIQAKNFTTLQLPTTNTTALGITIDASDQIWIAEGVGKLANIDPTNNFKITEYSPKGKNNTLVNPTALLTDPITGDIYISEHDGHIISVFNPVIKTFKEYLPLNSNSKPSGMALDGNANLWIAEQTINKIAIIDPRTGEYKEVTIPSPNPSPFIQWLTSDSRGNIWFAEQQADSLGVITINANPLQSGSPAGDATANSLSNNNQSSGDNNYFISYHYGFNYTEIVGPAVAAGIITSALFYTKSITDLRNSMKQVNKGVNNKFDRRLRRS
jgi:copper transport protein